MAGSKRGKTRARKSQLILVLLLNGWESSARFFSQPQSVAMQSQSNYEITFDSIKNLSTLAKQYKSRQFKELTIVAGGKTRAGKSRSI